MNKLYVIGVDPGVTTGVGVVELTDTSCRLVEVFQFGDPDNVWKQLESLALQYEKQGDVSIVYERFEFRATVRNPDITPKYIIKDIERYLTGRFDVRSQMPAHAKGYINPKAPGGDALKRFGMYTVGKRHANDGTRHALTYAAGNSGLRHEPTRLLGWPKEKKR